MAEMRSEQAQALLKLIHEAGQERVLSCWDKLSKKSREQLLHQLSQIASELESATFINNPPNVFISYAEEDKGIARKLQADLKRAKVNVFAAFDQIIPGDSLVERINVGLKRSNTLVLLWSKNAAKSEWVSIEWETALSKKKRIIPYLLDSTPLPEMLNRLMYITFTNYKEDYLELCKALGVIQKIET